MIRYMERANFAESRGKAIRDPYFIRLPSLISQKPPYGGLGLAPPRRLELRSSAPEADTLSTELRGRSIKFYHELTQAAATPLAALRLRQRSQFDQLRPILFDCFVIPAFVAEPLQLTLFM